MTSRILHATDVRPGHRLTVTRPGDDRFPADVTVTNTVPHTNHLGGRWADLTLLLPDGTTAAVDSRTVVLTTLDVPEHGYCPTCRARRLIEEESTESAHDLGREQHYDVTWFSCGHQDARHTGSSAAPGAPWAPDAHPTIRHARAASYREAASYKETDR
ncbi:hypothetical protein Pam4_61 [Pseudanabaena phage Pam4]|nr:hypothetical protein Pam4_61 [Pseudanabaena phage Pam4]